MVQPTEQEIRKKYSSLPDSIREILTSPTYSDEVREISETNGMNDEDKRVLAASIGLVFLGFIKPQNLFDEIDEYLEADEKVVVKAVRDVNRRIFIPLHKELEELHKMEGHIEGELEKGFSEPVVDPIIKTGERREEEVIPVERTNKKEKEVVATGIKIKKISLPEKAPVVRQEERIKTPTPKQEAEATPFVLHQEEKQESVAEGDKFKGINLPFGFFGKEERRTSSSEPVKVKVEAPGGDNSRPKRTPTRSGGLLKSFSKKKDDGKRVVHYSEYRTSLTPFGKPEEDIISLQNFAKEAPPKKVDQPTITPQPETAKAEAPKMPKIKKSPAPESKPSALKKKKTPKEAQKDDGGPSIEGNIVDLRQTTDN